MKGMREIRNRMKAVASTGQITHAMELVAASKMKRAQNSAEAGRAKCPEHHKQKPAEQWQEQHQQENNESKQRPAGVG